MPPRLALLLTAAAFAPAAAAADIDRGRALYEHHCRGCHSESVHARKTRQAANFDEVRGWVERWSRHLKTGWNAQDLDDVTMHVNSAYYGHPCPPAACRVVSRRR